jgi:hypothetical protein
MKDGREIDRERLKTLLHCRRIARYRGWLTSFAGVGSIAAHTFFAVHVLSIPSHRLHMCCYFDASDVTIARLSPE